MDSRKYMIIIEGRIRTSEVVSCIYDKNIKGWMVEFKSGLKISYKYMQVKKMQDPYKLDPSINKIIKKDIEFFDIEDIYVFKDKNKIYYHICFLDGKEFDCSEKSIKIIKSCLEEKHAKSVFDYIKEVADFIDIEDKETGENRNYLPQEFEKLSFIRDDSVLSKYLNPSWFNGREVRYTSNLIFPFGCNNSQYKAVKNAMENQISIIQGPLGTGKTQTILNIIANIILEGKNVQVVSNNNSAIENIYQKLGEDKYNLGFLVAKLGNSQNKKNFIENQNLTYPDFNSWKVDEDHSLLLNRVKEKYRKLELIFSKKERLAYLKQDLDVILLEKEYFDIYLKDLKIDIKDIEFNNSLSSATVKKIWQEVKLKEENTQKFGVLFKIKLFLKYGLSYKKLLGANNYDLSIIFQFVYYSIKVREIKNEIEILEKELLNLDEYQIDDLCKDSLLLLKGRLIKNYSSKKSREKFIQDDFWKRSKEFLKEYPIILSTTYSSRKSLGTGIMYDYLIIDEASQVDIVTGALALSCAKNVIVVGDTKQLPNVVKVDMREKAESIFSKNKLEDGYKYTNSFLQSVLDLMPNVKQVLLKEHYRCHPKIINFCNQKFYGGELVIMTKDSGESNVLKVIKTSIGNHERNHYNQRQIDVINKEILPKYGEDFTNVGIITPYRNQVKALKDEIKNIEIDTVHKFQGREKGNIIISTVDDEISDFVDDPYLLNVAISRAKNELTLVVTGNEQNRERNIIDLIDYIEYNNFEVMDSKIYSIFDFLYIQYTKERLEYLSKYKKISEYDSENLIYTLVNDIIKEKNYTSLDVINHYPLSILIKDRYLLDEEEYRYAINLATHVDFLIYNRIGKKAILAIEVDGYQYHSKDSIQNKRDLLKDKIMEKYDIPLLRLKTNGSDEKDKIIGMLEKLLE